ncbi:dATP/dGTP pyrophosphohydrolase domain-containing protein [Brucella sp. C7-11G]
MTIPDEAVQAAAANVEFPIRGMNGLRLALTAALPFLQGVKVKDLTWYDMPGISTAHDNNPRYCAVKTHNGKGVFSWSLEIHGLFSAKYDTLEAAKAAAQADYDTRILSAIEAGETIETYYARQIEWSKKTFGPALRTLGILDHIRKELKEIEAEPHDLSEWIDVVILAMDGFWRHGGTVKDLMPRLLAKQQKNMARDWPDWRNMSEDSAIEHDRTKDAAPSPRVSTSYEARICKGIPTDCCDYGVVDLSAGIEVCRVWKENDARQIAELLNGAPYPRAQALEEAAKIAEDYVQYDVADAIRLLSSQPVADGWLPIETAPKDGTIVLLGWNDPDTNEIGAVAGWYEDGSADKCWYDQYHEPVTVTHWMPLRPLPASPGASE